MILKRTRAISLMMLGAVACAPADETTDAAAPSESGATAPAVDPEALIALEEAVWEDLAAGDREAMRARMTDDFIILGGSLGFIVGADEWLALEPGVICEMESWSIDPPRVTVLSPTSAILTYRNQSTMACDGQPAAESEAFSTTVWVQRDGEWKMAYYSSVDAD